MIRASMPALGNSLVGLSILVVEDNEDNRDLLSMILGAAGATVTVAASATEAFEVFKMCTPSVIVTDIVLPHHDGVWLLNAVKMTPRFPRVPVVAITGRAMEAEQQRIRAEGFDACIIKPVLPESLIAVVEWVARTPPRGNQP